MPIEIQRNDLPPLLRDTVAKGILSAIGASQGIWQVALTSEPEANAWDVELRGPNKFYWSRRFSGGDRDADVISEAIRSAVLDQAA